MRCCVCLRADKRRLSGRGRRVQPMCIVLEVSGCVFGVRLAYPLSRIPAFIGINRANVCALCRAAAAACGVCVRVCVCVPGGHSVQPTPRPSEGRVSREPEAGAIRVASWDWAGREQQVAIRQAQAQVGGRRSRASRSLRYVLELLPAAVGRHAMFDVLDEILKLSNTSNLIAIEAGYMATRY